MKKSATFSITAIISWELSNYQQTSLCVKNEGYNRKCQMKVRRGTFALNLACLNQVWTNLAYVEIWTCPGRILNVSNPKRWDGLFLSKAPCLHFPHCRKIHQEPVPCHILYTCVFAPPRTVAGFRKKVHSGRSCERARKTPEVAQSGTNQAILAKINCHTFHQQPGWNIQFLKKNGVPKDQQAGYLLLVNVCVKNNGKWYQRTQNEKTDIFLISLPSFKFQKYHVI